MSEIILLTQEERDKFTLWLRQQATNMDGIKEQMAKLPGLEAMIKRETQRSIAYRIVAYDLENTESMTIGGEGG